MVRFQSERDDNSSSSSSARKLYDGTLAGFQSGSIFIKSYMHTKGLLAVLQNGPMPLASISSTAPAAIDGGEAR